MELMSKIYRKHKELIFTTYLKDKPDDQKIYQKIVDKEASTLFKQHKIRFVIFFLKTK